MKKLIGLLLLGGILLASCQSSEAYLNQSLPKWDDQNKVWIITDLHHLSPTLYDQGPAFQRIQLTAAGKDLRYTSERMDMLLFQIEQQKPSLLIVAGDLTLNGEYNSMVELQNDFAQIEALGTEVLVIPGNHDIANGWASSFFDTETTPTRQVRPEEFKELFGDFGYEGAISQDTASLSYVAAVSDRFWFLMIDSNQYVHSEGKGAPTTGGSVKDGTLRWIASEIQRAKKHGARLIPVVHHNSLVHFPMLSQHYTLNNAQEFQSILQASSIPVTFSGHIHAQHIQTQQQLTDIVTGAFSTFPAAIGEVRLSDTQLHYQQLALTSHEWAQKTNQTNLDLIDHPTYLRHVFEDDSKRWMYHEMIEKGWYRQGENDAVAEAFSIFNRAFFSGELAEQYDELLAEYGDEWQEIQLHADSKVKQYVEYILMNRQSVREITVQW